ncbi:PQQ-dependent sugar dehydrogenase [Chitinimonas naiadis]
MDTRQKPIGLLCAFVLASCGGGSSDGGTSQPGPGPSPDTEAPTATLTAPTNLAGNLTGTLTATAQATDNVGVAGVEFQVDGATIGSELGTAPYQVGIDTTAYAAGQHIVRVRSRDAAGNRSAWASATVRFGGTAGVPAGFSKNEAWVSGLNNATAIAQAPDGRLFVAQQNGALRIVKNGVLLSAPFHQFTVNASGERGLIGVAIHPDFANNGWVYVYYTTDSGGAHNRISRLKANGDVSAGEDASATLPINLPALSSATNHNGGALHFGNDGKLYVGVGDNANSAQAPNVSSVFGKLLRFNEDGTIPADNPFYAAQTGLARAVWAYGLRNPYTFAVQPGTGRIHINDVGQNTWEEIDVGMAGANYGWPASEGPANVGAGVSAPLFAYNHADAVPAGSGPGGFFTGLAIAGGAFYPNSGPFPGSYRGNYFFADFLTRFVARLDPANDNAAYAFANLSGSPVDMLVGNDGALYVLTRTAITRISAN